MSLACCSELNATGRVTVEIDSRRSLSTNFMRKQDMAERVGFEPTSPVLPGYPLSRRALSTAQTPLQRGILAKPHAFSNPRSAIGAGQKMPALPSHIRPLARRPELRRDD